MPQIDKGKPKTKVGQERIKWKEFRQTWKDCEACPLHQTRHRICLARGSVPADVLFIGEGPGQSEDTLGQPFVGPAGKLLDEMIHEALQPLGHEQDTGAQRPDGGWYSTWMPTELRLAYTNIVCCIPIGEDGKKAVEPLAEHAKACSPRLIEFIDKVAQPKFVVLVGKYAAKYIKKFYPKTPSWASVEITHPAAILRSDIGQQGLLIQRNTITIRDCFETVLESQPC